jgi:hypothetical protein
MALCDYFSTEQALTFEKDAQKAGFKIQRKEDITLNCTKAIKLSRAATESYL